MVGVFLLVEVGHRVAVSTRPMRGAGEGAGLRERVLPAPLCPWATLRNWSDV
jgi:hypothetical protein